MTTPTKAWVLVSVLASTFSIAAGAAEFGRIEGKFDVSPTGAAGYRIPLWTPDGPQGVQPTLALQYDSQDRFSTAGIGWSLVGASAIERCGRTQAQDAGEIQEVMLASTDRFCMGGNRLRVTSGAGTYGLPSSTYQLELQQFLAITAQDTAGNGPKYFTAKGKDGWDYEFGATTDSRVFPGSAPNQATTPLRWMVNKITDRNGNRMIFTYQNNWGVAVPTRIEWAPTSPSGYLYSVDFTWDADSSPSVFRGFAAQYPIVQNNRLKSITIKQSGAVVRKYVLDYESGAKTQGPRLKTLTECADQGASICLLPTTFSYQDGTSGVTQGPGPVPSGSGSSTTAKDFNGDGKDDLLYKTTGNWQVAFAAASGFGTPVDTGFSSTSYLLGKFSPNGGVSFIVNVGGSLTSYRYNGSAFVSAPIGVSHSTGTLPVSVDMNGDGLQDFAWTSGLNILFRRNTTAVASGHPSFESSSWTGATLPSSALGGSVTNPVLMPHITAPYGFDRFDVNGDGRQDLFVQVQIISGMSGAPYILTLKSKSNQFEVEPTSSWASFAQRTLLNFNEDNCTDRLVGRVITVSSCGAATGGTFSIPGSEPIRALLDWNGDGKTDVLVATGSTLSVYRSLGTAFATLEATTVSSTGAVAPLDQDGDRKGDLLRAPGGSAAVYYTATATGSPPTNATNISDLLTTITDGFGNTISISYVTTAQSNYSPGTPPTSQWVQEADPQIVVSNARFSYGMGPSDYYDISYSYTGARYDASWKRFAGFQEIQETDSRNGVVTTTEYKLDFPFWMYPKKETRKSGLDTISTMETKYQFPYVAASEGSLYFLYPDEITIQNFEVGGTKNGQLITTRKIEILNVNVAYGNIGRTRQTVTDNDALSPFVGQSWITTTDRAFDAVVPGSQCLDSPTELKVTKSAPGTTDIVRTIAYVPDVATKCRPVEEIVEPLSNAYKVRTQFQYDSFGNVNRIDVTGRKPSGASYVDMTARSTTIGWDAYGIYPTTEINPESHPRSRTYYYNHGSIFEEYDENGLKTVWDYDAFGRVVKVTRPDGTKHQIRYVDCAALPNFCNNNRRGVIWDEELDGFNNVVRADKSVIDQYGRDIEVWEKTSNTATDAAYSVVFTHYDAFNRVKRVSAPCLNDYCGSPFWTDYSYDISNRITEIARPRSETDSTRVEQDFAYEGRTAKLTERLSTDPPNTGRTTVTVSDASGAYRQVRDPANYGNNYTYDAAGSLLAVSDSDGVQLLYGVEYQYGIGAFQTKMTDADMGPWEWTYDSLGDMVAWKDAKLQTFTADFDRLSRPVSRTEPGNSVSWVWDTYLGVTRKGRLMKTSNTAAGQTYAEEFGYDSLNRISQRRYVLPSVATFEYNYAYDDTVGKTGLLDTLEFPTTVGTRLKLKYEYQSQELVAIKNANSPTTSYWSLLKTDAFGGPTEELHVSGLKTRTTNDAVTGLPKTIYTGTDADTTQKRGASYLYDQYGNVTQRLESKLSLTEDFYYDSLNRLTSSTLKTGAGSPQPNANFQYANNGNITQFGGATYNYTTAQAGCSYYAHAQPHAVRKAGTSVYCYDQNGNATSRGGFSISWTSFNYPSVINGASSQSAQFSYGPQRQRWKMVYTRGSEVETTWYAGPALEKVVRPNGDILYRHRISAYGAVKAIVTRNGATGTDTVRHILSGQDGSTDAFLATDGSMVRASFTAFGDRRDATTWSGTPSQTERDTLDSITREGYTYQTVLGALGLNHMNGRVQDAVSGRFLSADPYVFEPLDSQGFNRYSYVYNNPITFTDPSGFRTETRTGTYCHPTPMTPPGRGNNRSPLDGDGVPHTSWVYVPSSDVKGGGYWAPLTTSPLELAPIINTSFYFQDQCTDYTYQVEIEDPPRETSWWDRAKAVAGTVADFVPVVSTIKGAYEAYKVITDPNASKTDKLIAMAGVLPYGKALKYGKKGLEAAQDLKKFLSRVCCFVAGTLVMTDEGLRPIEEIGIGDKVLSRDEETGETAFKEVTALHRRAERDIWEVRILVTLENGTQESRSFETTDDHPWWIAGAGWVATRDLRMGDAVETMDGLAASIEVVSHAGMVAPTYNLEVADFHSYFVGELGVWVHNGKETCDISGLAQRVSGETKFTSAGRRAHQQEPLPPGYKRNVRIPGTNRTMDGYNPDTKTIREIKPDNPRAVKRGEKQLGEYCETCNNSPLGGGHKVDPVQTYDPSKYVDK